MSHRLLPLAAVLLLAAAPLRADDADDRALKAVKDLGGEVVRIGDDPGKPVVNVDLHATGTTDADLKRLVGLKGLWKVNLSDCKGVTDKGMKELAGLQGLEVLYLSHTGVTDVGLKDLAGLKSLQFLNLAHCPGVTDAALPDLSAVKGLKYVRLYLTKVTPAGTAALRKELPACHIP